MPIVETRILDIDLPQFLLDFRDISLSWVLSPLQKGITIVNELNDENHKSTVSFLLQIIIVIQLFRLIWEVISQNRSQNPHNVGSEENIALQQELQNLRKEAKNLHKQVQELLAQDSVQKDRPSVVSQVTNKASRRIVSEIMSIYERGHERCQRIIEFILSSQENVLKELKKLKKFRNKSDRASNSFEEEDSVGDSLGTPSNSKPLGKLFSSNKDKSLVKDRSLIFFEADRPAEAISQRNGRESYRPVHSQIQEIQFPESKIPQPKVGIDILTKESVENGKAEAAEHIEKQTILLVQQPVQQVIFDKPRAMPVPAFRPPVPKAGKRSVPPPAPVVRK